MIEKLWLIIIIRTCLLSVALALLALAIIVYCVKLEPAMAQEIIVIPDPNLEKVIRAEDATTGKKAITSANITKADMESIMYLDGAGEDIRDLSGLAYCINLQSLDLSYNNIDDLTPLEGHERLTCLNLSYNQISDIQALARLSNLEELYLNNNNVVDINILKNMPGLKTTDLSHNNISNISALVGLTEMEQIILSNNNISDIMPLVDNPMESIDVRWPKSIGCG